MGYSPAGKTGVKVAIPKPGDVSGRINNAVEAKEDPVDDLRVDIYFQFAYVTSERKAAICRRIHEAFPGKLCEVRFANRSNKHMVVRTKSNGRGVARCELINYAKNGFT